MHKIYTLKIFSFLIMAFLSFTSVNAQVSDFILTANSPGGVVGDYSAFGASFGPSGCALNDLVIDGVDVIFADNGSGVTTSCDVDGTVMVDATDKVLFLDRGVCGFTEKVLNAIPTNAIAVVICSDDRDPTNPGGADPGTIDIPTFMISFDDCQLLRVEIANGLNISIAKDPNAGFVNENRPPDANVLFFESFSGGLAGWTNIPISTNDPDVELSELQWEYAAQDVITNACNIGRSNRGESACDGAVYFNFQSFNRKECTVDGNTSLRYSAELVSPAIDLSSLSDTSSFQLTFTQLNIPLNGANSVSYSVDGGENYSDPIAITTENVFSANATNIVGNESVLVPLPSIGNPSEFRLKFIAEGDFYFWLIDDIYLSELTGANASIVETFYTPLSYVFPSIHGDADPFLWQAQVRNNGGTDLVDGVLSVSVAGSSGNIVHTDQLTVDLIEVGTVDTLNINDGNLYLPSGLDPDTYTVTFDVDFPGLADNDLTDNSSSYEFVVSDTYWAKENIDEAARGSSRYILSGTTDEDWGVAAAYIASPTLATDQAHSIELSVNSTDGSMKDNFVTVYLLEYADDSSYAFNEDQSFDRASVDLNNHPDFNVLYRNVLIFDDSYVPGSTISLDLINRPNQDPIDDAIVFEPGRGYVIAVQFDNSQGGDAPVSNFDLSLGSDASIDGNGLYVFGTRDAAPFWFTGFTNGTAAPHLRLYRRMFSSTNTPQLEEGAFKVNPNPASDFLNIEIELNETATTATLDIAGMDGRIISSQSYNNVQSDTKQVDVANLPNGTYMVRLSTEKGSTIHKVVVQH